MERTSTVKRRRESARREIAGKGWAAIGLGVMLLVVAPLLMRSPMTAMLATAVRPAGWAALAIGVALLALHYVLRRIAASNPVAQVPPRGTVMSQTTKGACPEFCVRGIA